MDKRNQIQAGSLLQMQIDHLVELYEKKSYIQAIIEAEKLIIAHPDSFVLWNLVGAACQAIEKFEKAERSFRRTIEINPTFASAYNNLGVTLQHQGKFDAAIEAYEQAISIKPNYVESYYNMGVTLQKKGEINKAIAVYEQAVVLKPNYAEAFNNLGAALHDQGILDEAISAFNHALTINANYAIAHKNLGNVLKDKGELNAAIHSYKRALTIWSDYLDAWNNLGVVLHKKGAYDHAIAAYERALALKPDYAYAYNNIGNTLTKQRRLDTAIAAYERALALKPDYVAAEAEFLHQKQHICDFNAAPMLSAASTRLAGSSEAIPPFAILSWVDDPKDQLLHSRKWAVDYYKQPTSPLPTRPKVYPTRLKVGYFSADVHDHATMFLLGGMLRTHNMGFVEVFIYSYGRDKSGDWQKKLNFDADHFFDVTELSDRDISELARSHGLDIAIDLKGYTENSRSDIFQYRPAPIQINYLGYPGSMGADFIDYIIADPLVIPPEHRKFYTEKIIYMPNTYFPTDNTRGIAHTTTRRSDFNLPDDSFVFCCFNNNYKISPREFDIWMRLLRKVEGSVLWLLKSNGWAKQNLRKEAEKRGIDSSRLVFAEVLPHAEHLARHKHADLFVDTFNCNAHTTASDALWSGLPIVTKQGKQFAARVCASLLTAVGLPELITHSDTEYERLILELATDPERLGAIRADLAENRLTKPLFDTKLYTRHFEKGLWQAYSLYFNGKQPENLWA